ncbi:calcium-dependent protein kinase 29 [Sesbania bispinosa]|nr:calcium-dependent protein kinase 29 [Sesbania bispinosa]KAJ1413413.1 calcium-dependent protein kinase 29 [Sesbania bispinosa]KAJ1420943.1 calcium-dependent protein kinase 29 [Sesbania bispinosa]
MAIFACRCATPEWSCDPISLSFVSTETLKNHKEGSIFGKEKWQRAKRETVNKERGK